MNFPSELETLIRARYPILYIVTSEELRVQNVIVDVAKKRQKKVFEWSYSTGIVPAGTSIQSQKNRSTATKGAYRCARSGHRAGRTRAFRFQGPAPLPHQK